MSAVAHRALPSRTLADHDPDEMAVRRGKVARMRDASKQIAETNRSKLAAARPAVPRPREPSSRDRAIEFAKNIPRPRRASAGWLLAWAACLGRLLCCAHAVHLACP